MSIKNEKLLNSNNNRSKSKFLRLLCDIIIFRLVAYIVEYGLFNITNLTQNLTYIRFGIILTVFYQFLETGTSDRSKNSYRSQSTPESLRFQPIYIGI